MKRHLLRWRRSLTGMRSILRHIPVPHGDIPSQQADNLASVLKGGKRPILLYCRTGKRAIRTYCLAEASRTDGHSEPELSVIAKNAGFSIDDLHADDHAPYINPENEMTYKLLFQILLVVVGLVVGLLAAVVAKIVITGVC